jgi:hypothetical protein
MGIFPAIMLVCLNDAAEIGCWCAGTAPRPNSLPDTELNPARTREFVSASLMFEN